MAAILFNLAMFLLGVALAVLLIVLRFRVRPKRVNLPFVEFDISRFDSLTPVHFFRELTALLLVTVPREREAGTMIQPLARVHAGWMMVCEAFVERFKLYPTDENVRSVASTLGGQNVEFVILFRQIYESSVRAGDKLGAKFAESFVSRAPALAQRVSGNATPLQEYAAQLYQRWNM